MDLVFTVCDTAAGEVCPVWPGQPMTAHWSFPDPAAFQGSDPETRAFFASVYGQLCNRIAILSSLPTASLDELSLQKWLDAPGKGAHDAVAEDVARRTESSQRTESRGSDR
ncbi:MAG: hypothetical protein GWN84_00980 [Gammaproteobacteria bacterium]|nr:hypothetical protein [Gammaproteobacteria bacterium]NIR81770.1 hypothetical protein [Gammaproteobacteria bacterium]NIR88573.1 hypothetical protein [Gammaproteobacteria bacterium]NIU02877.1 hypothetical protein [Gammaproteobacteria bacterium]NIV50399.1 hypothetical protein [Gammaproteobacteria bacterium]